MNNMERSRKKGIRKIKLTRRLLRAAKKLAKQQKISSAKRKVAKSLLYLSQALRCIDMHEVRKIKERTRPLKMGTPPTEAPGSVGSSRVGRYHCH